MLLLLKRFHSSTRQVEKLAAIDEKLEFIKQVPVHPGDRLKRLKNRPKKNISKMENINAQIISDNTDNLMLAEFDFSPKKILNKTLIFDTSKIDEEIIMDRITDALNDKTNDEFYIEHSAGSNYFTLRRENRR